MKNIKRTIGIIIIIIGVVSMTVIANSSVMMNDCDPSIPHRPGVQIGTTSCDDVYIKDSKADALSLAAALTIFLGGVLLMTSFSNNYKK